jgi:predicted AAA+ superfamily ATPase
MVAALALDHIVARRTTAIASSRLAEEPVVAIQGARAVGKSTLLGQLASGLGAQVLDLDDLAVRDAVAADPGTFVAGPSPVCIDEYQHVPPILDAIKAELNRDLRPGRFVLTGSTRYEALPLAAQSLAGRLHLLSVWPLSQAEIAGNRENLLEVLFLDPSAAVTSSRSTTTRTNYIARIIAGGFPIPLARTTTTSRNRWFDDYVRLVLERDVRELARIRQREQLPDLLRRLAGQTAEVLNLTSAANASGMDRTTVSEYVRLLEAVFLVYRLEAWGKTLRARVACTPKIHVVDSGVAGRLLRLTPERLGRRDPASLTEFGHLLETFVVSELLKQASWAEGIAGSGHWRTHDGDEVDLVVERDDGAVVAFEVKAAARVPGNDMRSLRKLRDAVGDAFLAGVALYTGDRSYVYEDRLCVLPVDRIWNPI